MHHAILVAFILLLIASLIPSPSTAQEPCQFVAGFADMRALVGPEKVGECLENEHPNPENGNVEQATTGGLLVWRASDGVTLFTDGGTTWVNGPNGLESRPNSERFSWETDPPQQPAGTAEQPPAPSLPAAPTPPAPPATSTPRTVAPAAPPPPTATPRPPSNATVCCRTCTTGKACGDSCIARSRNCNVGRGCACDASTEPDLPALTLREEEWLAEEILIARLNELPSPCDDVTAVEPDLMAEAR